MFSKTLSIIYSLLFVSALMFSNSALCEKLELLWSIKNTFNMPESAAFDETRQVIYVSNVNQYAKDGNGFISRVSADGKSIKLKWLTGLNSPTGLAVYGDTLYAADYDALVAVDLVSNKITHRFDAPDAGSKPALNDVAISKNGVVYVSGSASQTIYRLLDNKLKVWLKDEAWIKDKKRLKFANGLFVREDALSIKQTLFHGGLYWSAFDITSGKLVASQPQPDENLKDFDGITSDGQGGFFVTVIDDDRIWHIQKNGISQALSEKKLKGIDLQYLPERKLLLLPQVGGGLSAFRVE